MTIKRQPKGVPIGGQFAKNEHGDATGALSAASTSPVDGWRDSVLEEESERFDGDVVSPDGTRYQVRRLMGDVVLTMTDSEGRVGVRKFTPSESAGVDDIMSGRGLRAVTRKPRSVKGVQQPHADFRDHGDDAEVVDALVRRSMLQEGSVRYGKPMSARWIERGDIVADDDGGQVDSVERNGDIITLHYRDGRSSERHTDEAVTTIGVSRTVGEKSNTGLESAARLISER